MPPGRNNNNRNAKKCEKQKYFFESDSDDFDTGQSDCSAVNISKTSKKRQTKNDIRKPNDIKDAAASKKRTSNNDNMVSLDNTVCKKKRGASPCTVESSPAASNKQQVCDKSSKAVAESSIDSFKCSEPTIYNDLSGSPIIRNSNRIAASPRLVSSSKQTLVLAQSAVCEIKSREQSNIWTPPATVKTSSRTGIVHRSLEKVTPTSGNLRLGLSRNQKLKPLHPSLLMGSNQKLM